MALRRCSTSAAMSFPVGCASRPSFGINKWCPSSTVDLTLFQRQMVAASFPSLQSRIRPARGVESRNQLLRFFDTSNNFKSIVSVHELECKRLFCSSSKCNVMKALEPKNVSNDAAIGDSKGETRYSLIELFRNSQRSKSLTACSKLNNKSMVFETESSNKRGTPVEKKKNAKSGRKNQNAKALVNSNDKESNKTDDRGLSQKKVAPARADVKASKTSPGRKNAASAIPSAVGYTLSAGRAKTMNGSPLHLYPPTGKSVMIVESATKAKTIQKYLGEMFEVLPSYGHVRDLAGRSGSVRPDDDFSMVWEVPASAWTHLKTIKMALNGAENLILATDPDREGEAIAWHLIEMLQQQESLDERISVTRIVFHEITESSIKEALQSPRELDIDLINAYLARRALDYLIGFSVSPLLWRKLPGCQSAGRVQSAALALICDRELEIDQFNPREYWTIGAEFTATGLDCNTSIPSELTHLDSNRLSQFSLCTRDEAESIEKRIYSSKFAVIGSKKSSIHRNPPMPYITSTLQQDAANKLHFTTLHTMKLAQRLYEGIALSNDEATGLITYMRTDGLHVSDAAAKEIHSLIKQRYGQNFASKELRKYFKKVKNAQEAHEAIRPTSIRRLPSTLAGILDDDALKLYTLIWTRAVACQMEASVRDMVQIDISNSEENIVLRSSGSRVSFLGYKAVYRDSEACHIGQNDSEEDTTEDIFKFLNELKVKDQLHLRKVECGQHYTKPPGRYSEGSLVKKLEELGIGRPSTYAPILKVLQDRKYVTMINRVLHPEFRGRMVSSFLSHYFSEVSDYSFTADMETELDNVSAGTTEWKGLLRDYWLRFKNYCDLAGNVNIRQLEKMLEKKFRHILFESLPDKSRSCPSCLEGTLIFKISRFGTGYFIGCDQHPKCKYIARTVFVEDEEGVPSAKPDNCFQPRLLGHNPGTNENIFLKKGPYGYYVQLGDDRKECPPKRSSVSEVKDIDSFTVEDAIELLRYPITLGNHPDDGHPVLLAHSKFGFSVRHKRTVSSLPKSKDPKKISLEAALKLLSSKNAKQRGRPSRKLKPEAAVC